MSRLTGRVEKLEEQTGAAGGTPLCMCYQAEGVYEVSGVQYASQEEARAANPASLFICLPMSRKDTGGRAYE
jgi:hypothetical protein